ncbi:MAG: transcription elongation factor GreA [Deltaproteobacteria bacterium]|nr:transcription elongation factor GreA [Deltaproteobacteria bacterium]
MAERVPMTPEGQQKLRDELHRLKEVEMPQVVRDISTARDHGDLSENAEYHAAKERQGMIHARTLYIEDVLSRAEVIDPSKLGGNTVKFGAHVTVLNLDTEEQVVYQIVGPEESDLNLGRISVSSPLARGLIGKQVGDEATIRLPAGNRTYEIQGISFR